MKSVFLVEMDGEDDTSVNNIFKVICHHLTSTNILLCKYQHQPFQYDDSHS